MKLIVISGAKYCKKDTLAMKLSQNSDCIWIKPYSDRPVRINSDDTEDRFIRLNGRQLDDKINKEVPLAITEINGHRYVFFENQLNADYVVLTGDDRIVQYLKGNWDGELVTVKCHSNIEQPSKISILDDDEFDIVFDVDNDDYDFLECQII